MTIFMQMTPWYWLSLGLIVLMLDLLLGFGGYGLWIGLAAFTVAVILFVSELSWQLQWLIFALQSLLVAFIWWRYQSKKDALDNQSTTLNERSHAMVGRVAELLESVEAGYSRVKIDDTVWPVHCDVNLAAGHRVKVIAVSGSTLTVEPFGQ